MVISSCAIQPLRDPYQKLPASLEMQKTINEHDGLTLKTPEAPLTVELEEVEPQVDQESLESDAELADISNEEDQEPESKIEYQRKAFLTFDEDSSRVQAWVDYFTNANRERFQRFINNGTPFKKDIEKILNDQDLPIDLYYVGLIESGYNLRARSHAAAVGPWQFVKSAAKDYGLNRTSLIDERYDLYKSTYAAAVYFKDLYNIFGSWELALSAYNAGPNRIIYLIRKENTRDFAKLSKSKRFPKETGNYIPKVIAVMKILNDPDKYGFKIPNNRSIFSNSKNVKLRYSLPLNLISQKLDVPVKTLQKLNPELISNRTPFSKNGPYNLRVPKTTYQTKSNVIASLFNYRRTAPYAGNEINIAGSHSNNSTHKVRRGENLSFIARKYGISLTTLKKLNDLSQSHIYAGQKLKVRKSISSTREVANSKIHKVKRGENLTLIARKYGMTLDTLKSINNLKSSIVWIGQKLKINSTAKNIYIVRRGDNLNYIAKKFGKSMKNLMAKNDLKSSRIFPGQELEIR